MEQKQLTNNQLTIQRQMNPKGNETEGEAATKEKYVNLQTRINRKRKSTRAREKERLCIRASFLERDRVPEKSTK